MALAGLDVWQVIELVSGEIVGAHMVELELLLVCDIRCVHMAFEWVDFAPFLAHVHACRVGCIQLIVRLDG